MYRVTYYFDNKPVQGKSVSKDIALQFVNALLINMRKNTVSDITIERIDN